MQFLKKLLLAPFFLASLLLLGCEPDVDNTDDWQPSNFTITFDPNGGTIETTTQTVEGGAADACLYSAETLGLEREGYDFAGWAYSADASSAYFSDEAWIYSFSDGMIISQLSEDTTLYAVWKLPEVYMISFDANGGEIKTTSQQVLKGEKLKLFSAETLGLTRSGGYVFNGWATQKNASYATYEDEEEFTPSEDKILYAL